MKVQPEHYQRSILEPWHIISNYYMGFAEGNILKYMYRVLTREPSPLTQKDIQDIHKAMSYIDMQIEQVKSDVCFFDVQKALIAERRTILNSSVTYRILALDILNTLVNENMSEENKYFLREIIHCLVQCLFSYDECSYVNALVSCRIWCNLVLENSEKVII